jgi:hypothetical protein
MVLYLRPFFAAGQMRVNTNAARFLDAVMLGGRWDVELAITFALERRNPVLALGHVKGEYGAAKLSVDDADWQQTMMDLAARAIAIIIVPLNRPATLWEVRHFFSQNHLLAKTLFVMPPTAGLIRNFASFCMQNSIRHSWRGARGRSNGRE